MSRNEIAFMLRQWIANGALKTKISMGVSYPTINKMIAEKELFPTSFPAVVCTSEKVRDEFEGLVAKRRIMDGTMVKLEKGLLTLYAINMACADGQFLRFPEFGKSCVLYID